MRISLVDYEYKVEVFNLRINTDFTKEFLEIFITDSLQNIKKNEFLKGRKIVHVEILKQQPFKEGISGVLYFRKTNYDTSSEIPTGTTVKSTLEFNIEPSEKMKLKLSDKKQLEYIYLQSIFSSTVNSYLDIPPDISEELSKIYSYDLITIAHIEKHILNEINKFKYIPIK